MDGYRADTFSKPSLLRKRRRYGAPPARSWSHSLSTPAYMIIFTSSCQPAASIVAVPTSALKPAGSVHGSDVCAKFLGCIGSSITLESRSSRFGLAGQRGRSRRGWSGSRTVPGQSNLFAARLIVSISLTPSRSELSSPTSPVMAKGGIGGAKCIALSQGRRKMTWKKAFQRRGIVRNSTLSIHASCQLPTSARPSAEF